MLDVLVQKKGERTPISEISFDVREGQNKHSPGNVLEMIGEFADSIFQFFEAFFVDDNEQSEVAFREIFYHGSKRNRGSVSMDIRQNMVHADRVDDGSVVPVRRKGAEELFGFVVVV